MSSVHTHRVSPGVPPGLGVFTPSRALQRSMEALNTLKKDKGGWPPLNNLEAEEIVTAHRIEKPTPSSSQGGEQMIWDTIGKEGTHKDSMPIDIQSQYNDDAHSKKRPRVGDSPEALNPQEIREHKAKRGLAGARQLVDHLSSWISDQNPNAFSKDAADDFWGMVSYLRDCCEDAAKQMAFLKGRLEERADMNLIRNELQLLTQERPSTGYAAAAAHVPPVKINNQPRAPLINNLEPNVIIFYPPQENSEPSMTSAETGEQVKKIINPREGGFQIQRTRGVGRGGFLLQTRTREEKTKIMNDNKVAGSGLMVVEPSRVKPKIKIYDIPTNIDKIIYLDIDSQFYLAFGIKI